MKISLGNLPQSLKEDELKKMLSSFGEVVSVHIKRDKKTNTSLGYGSAEMSDENGMNSAINGLNGKEIEGKKIVLVEAEKLQAEHQDKHWDKNAGGKLQPNNFSGFRGGGGPGSAVRRSGGGGRGK
ncbi:MAG: RNA-binding protein [Leptospiraceae bacterium]|nr:RNA-binding protein [Leptospiraceae bacterium]MCK6382475.1 RNA-binding protein [Leptospiraceae bacterium]NUM42422.1 RNA-binding protein [Leptospiraceae bacterium]